VTSELTQENLEKLVGNEFQFAREGHNSTFSAKLDEVKTGLSNGERFESFNMYFVLPESEANLTEQGNYEVDLDTLGKHVLFASPKSPRELEFCLSFDREKRAQASTEAAESDTKTAEE